MASVTATATLAAAGFDKRSSASSSLLQTPGSGTFPSELLSPMAASPGYMKREDALKTPITPPSAYLDFLRNMSPAIVSPAASTSTSARFSFHDKPSALSDNKPLSFEAPKSSTFPTSQPLLTRNPSYDSNSSTGSEQSAVSHTSAATAPGASHTRPESPRIIIPPSPFAKPASRSARTPRLRIPQSPFSAGGASVKSATGASPYSGTPLSAAPWSASFSPRDHSYEATAGGPPGRVSVRHVVTRTVTYCRTPLEPAPKGKRRKIEREAPADVITEAAEEDAPATSASGSPPRSIALQQRSSEEPPLKKEKIEEIDEVSTVRSSSPAVPVAAEA